MKNYPLLLLSALLTMAGCTPQYAPLATVEKVDLQRYAGTWYEIARYEHYFEKGCRNVTATYTLTDEGKVEVLNRCTDEEGKRKEAKGIAYAVDESNSRLKVSFFRPFYGDYWILLLDEEYRYVLVGDPSREYLWILSRTPQLDDAIVQSILQKLPSLGYTAAPLIWTKQGE